ncbi:hypothetical protein V7S43_002049 [Phytophthora oleae]|uniref:Crinkler effector protein N-terminal domain-containing protein n=1 Tax=Phytophthora oleae TaxID=2107226 RepID=A0ABD3G3G0_9STRA
MAASFCAIVGKSGNAFPVGDAGQLVAALKYVIKEEISTTINCSEKNMKLFLAKKTDGTWLDKNDLVAVNINQDGNPKGFEEMNPSLLLKNEKYFGDNFQPTTGQVHVLAVVKEDMIASKPIRKAYSLVAMNLDSKDEWLEDFHTKRLYHPLPSMDLDSLRDFIKQPLPVKIRLPSALHALWSSSPVSLGEEFLNKMFLIDDENPCYRLIEWMLAPLRSQETSHCFIWLYYTMIHFVLEYVFPDGTRAARAKHEFNEAPRLFLYCAWCLSLSWRGKRP